MNEKTAPKYFKLYAHFTSFSKFIYGGLIWFYGISVIVGYLMSNLVYINIIWYIWFVTNNSIKHQSFVYRQLNDHTVLFLTIQFSISQQS